MSNQAVVYEMSLNDLLTPKLEHAERTATRFESKLHEVGERAERIFEGLGITFAVFEGMEFIKDSVEQMHKLHDAEAQVEAGLESTHHAAGLVMKDLDESARGLEERFKYSRAEIMDMQAQLLTFPAITKDAFAGTEQAVLDMASRLHQAPNQLAIMLGKAMQDPEKGMNALRRIGVNFTKEQIEAAKQMVATGQIAKVQTGILKELSVEFGGSAAAAAAADPLFRYNKIMESIKLEVGDAAISLLHDLTPALEFTGNVIKSGIGLVREFAGWMRENKHTIQDVATVLAVATGAYYAYNLISERAVIWSGIKQTYFAVEAVVLNGLGAAVDFVNAAFIASPIGWIVAGLAAVTAGVLYAWRHFEGFRGVLFGVWEVIKGLGHYVVDVFVKQWMGLGEIIHGALTLNWGEVKKGFSDATAIFHTGGLNIAENFSKGYADGVKDFRQEGKNKSLLGEEGHEKKGLAMGATTGITGTTKAAKAATGHGTKNISISIKIGSLIDNFSINTKNLQESAAKIREQVTAALLSAVNDSQIVAGT